MRSLVIIVVVLYALCMALVFLSRDRKRRRAESLPMRERRTSQTGSGFRADRLDA